MRFAIFFFSALVMAGCSTPRATIDQNTNREKSSQINQEADNSLLAWSDIFSGGPSQERFGNVIWHPFEDSFLKIEQSAVGSQIVKYNAETMAPELWISSEELTPSNTTNPLRPASVVFDTNEEKLLIYTNTKRVWRENTRGDYWVFDLVQRNLRQLGSRLPESSLMFAKFNNAGTHVAYVSQHNLYVEELSSGMIKALTSDGNEDLINGTFDWAYEEELFCKDGFRWSPDNQTIAFWQIDASQIGDYLMINTTDSIYPYTIPVEYPKAGQDPSAAKIATININTGNVNWIPVPGDPKQNYLPRMQWISSTELIIQQLNRHQNHLKLWRYSIETGNITKFYSEKDEAWVDILNMDASAPWTMSDLEHGDDALFRLTEKDGWRHLYKLPLDGSPEQLLTDGDFDLARTYTFHFDVGFAYALASPDNPMQRYLFSVSLNSNLPPKKLTPDIYEGFNRYNISPSGKYAIHTHSNAQTPGNVHLIRLPSHEIIKTLVDNKSYHDQLMATPQPTQEFFTVTTQDGITMEGRMYKPHDFDPNKQYPVLFYVYGEPAGQTAVDTWNGNKWITYLTQQGYIYITMDNRGSPSLKGRQWRKSIYRNIGRINIRDQAMAAQEVLKWRFTDTSRVAVWGWSGGGATTLNLLFQYPDIFQTGVAVAAVTNQLYYDNIYQERFMGLPQENMEDFVAGSPVTHARNLRGNLLYIHGTNDDNVHYQNAEALINELILHNKQFDMMSYPGRSHGIFEGTNTTNHLYRKMTDFIMEHCPPGGMQRSEKPSPKT